ncbi:MAG: lamin tail domain-containing protein [Verrucomicrobia bacterium]|nr:lamin tail domain-containing protein [Verrucomicrobiota bacterium]
MNVRRYLPLLLWPLAARAAVVINEIHYGAEPPLERVEFVELVNIGPGPEDLSGWRFDDGIQNASYTISAWAKPADAGRNPILGDFWIPPAFMLLAEVGGLPTYRHRMAVAPASDTFTVSSAAWTVNQWNHLAVAWDPTGQVARFYVDGASVARKVVRQPAENLPMVDNNRDFYIGRQQITSDTFNGLLDEIRVIRGAVNAPGAQLLAQSNLLLRTHVLDLADATPISPPPVRPPVLPTAFTQKANS